MNIVLQENSLQGTNGSVGANVGNRNQGLNGSLNVRRSKLGVKPASMGIIIATPYRSSTSSTDFTPPDNGQLA
jgi:ferric enterobactin receptor